MRGGDSTSPRAQQVRYEPFTTWSGKCVLLLIWFTLAILSLKVPAWF